MNAATVSALAGALGVVAGALVTSVGTVLHERVVGRREREAQEALRLQQLADQRVAICGTSHQMAPVQAVARGQRPGLLITGGGAILDETFHPWCGMAIAVHRGDYAVGGALQVGRSPGACAGARPGSPERGAR